MASNNRKLQPGQGCTFTLYFPFSQTYPPPPPPPPPQRDLSVIVSTSICIIGSVLLFLFLIVFLYLYITKSSRRRSSPSAVAPVVSSTRRREEENEEEAAGGGERDHHHFWSIATLGLHRSAIDSITVVVFKKGEGVIDGTDCSVCLSEFEEDEGVRLLPKCSHAFHVSCIDTWLLSHKNCPLCRAPVFSTEVRDKKTETNHQTESGSGSRNGNVLPRSQSDLASHCGGSEGSINSEGHEMKESEAQTERVSKPIELSLTVKTPTFKIKQQQDLRTGLTAHEIKTANRFGCLTECAVMC